jgi:hypothetical protein
MTQRISVCASRLMRRSKFSVCHVVWVILIVASCIHCKTCDIKVPDQGMLPLTPPEHHLEHFNANT